MAVFRHWRFFARSCAEERSPTTPRPRPTSRYGAQEVGRGRGAVPHIPHKNAGRSTHAGVFHSTANDGQAEASALSIQLTMAFFGAAPTCCEITWPSFTSSSVGMPRTP